MIKFVRFTMLRSMAKMPSLQSFGKGDFLKNFLVNMLLFGMRQENCTWYQWEGQTVTVFNSNF